MRSTFPEGLAVAVRAQDDVERLVPGHVDEPHGDVARHGRVEDDVETADSSEK